MVRWSYDGLGIDTYEEYSMFEQLGDNVLWF